jgi:hypothetical protein
MRRTQILQAKYSKKHIALFGEIINPENCKIGGLTINRRCCRICKVINIIVINNHKIHIGMLMIWNALFIGKRRVRLSKEKKES